MDVIVLFLDIMMRNIYSVINCGHYFQICVKISKTYQNLLHIPYQLSINIRPSVYGLGMILEFRVHMGRNVLFYTHEHCPLRKGARI